MKQFTIFANESYLPLKNGGGRILCLKKDTPAYYNSDYIGGLGRHTIKGTIENLICTFKNDITRYSEEVLRAAKNHLYRILLADLPQILNDSACSSLMVCVIPRAKHENYYDKEQKLFRFVIQYAIQNGLTGYVDGTHNIIRHTDTATTHWTHSGGSGGNGPMPYCGITNDTCTISGVQGKDILLIDDLYTKKVGIDEDAIQALYDHGASSVCFYSIGRTVLKYTK